MKRKRIQNATVRLTLPLLATALIPGTTALADIFTYTGTEVYFTAPTTGTYDITAYGAQGGGNFLLSAGGLGAEASAYFNLTAGELLDIFVGGQGGSGNLPGDWGGGGGGASFVFVDSPFAPLVVAGGGGGASWNGPGGNGQAGTAGGTAGGTFGGVGGTGGFGGAAGFAYATTGGPSPTDGAGGTGIAFGAGVGQSADGGPGFGGASGGLYQQGGDGGYKNQGNSPGDNNGGFGGGGGGGYSGGGGGGGYSGGGGAMATMALAAVGADRTLIHRGLINTCMAGHCRRMVRSTATWILRPRRSRHSGWAARWWRSARVRCGCGAGKPARSNRTHVHRVQSRPAHGSRPAFFVWRTALKKIQISILKVHKGVTH